ncbi:MAG: 16S rRNA (adenine(1518)-N(6)/adenine(1519)-N(6))-dimethyltransferase RsmA [Marinifilaceae bacterium]|jgi:16S rRNA (adenine1518-N6/adenine1519-N6)-dimethyltransferase|nr:16S rRNA (adenine(1518)-N(6)/adenine(1519)-N(6))-dimethyltransferase RsmA [Marinilabiliaceae bacterium JC040]MCT4600727.1 16S rRNA (adenine(1518)-N(6)/adenine(1519)-N(6))-dimethyltransferase RsmA [Marinifilaceae bacterium]
MGKVTAKKSLGQHFLKDLNIAKNICDSLIEGDFSDVLEIGPGMGVLTQYLLPRTDIKLTALDIDIESIDFLHDKYPQYVDQIQYGDFLKLDIDSIFENNFAIIGNFPYNISSQIFFRVLDYKDRVPEVVCMIQKEVAERLAANHGNKTYGILSVLLQTFYKIEYIQTVNENVFDPPPKVKSAVIRLTRNDRKELDISFKFFKNVVKTGFNQRRKTLRNSLKPILLQNKIDHEYLSMRPEQLSVEQFIELAKMIKNVLET